MNNEKKWLTVLGLTCVFGLSACGGGGDEHEDDDDFAPPPPNYPAPTPPSPPTSTTGVFKDANVSGLEYNIAGGATQVTGTDGAFSGIGQQVTFKVGGVSLGSATGRSLVTPIHLVTGGSSASTSVQNIGRFLMMLDTDNNPTNGIAISPAVRSMAPNWQQINFATADLPSALTTIISDVASVDSRVPVLPTATTARAHLENNYLCAYSGAFIGTYGGQDAGYWGLWIFAGPTTGTFNAGRVFGYTYSSIDSAGYGLTGGNALSITQAPTFSTAYTSTTTPADNFTVNGQFTTPDQITGTWTGGSFSGVRLGLSSTAVYKIAGVVQSGGVFVLNVDAANNLSGGAYYTGGNSLYIATSGTLNGQTVNATFTNGRTLTGTINATTNILTGSSNLGSGSGAVTGSICKLN